jgi:hypothetical protein
LDGPVRKLETGMKELRLKQDSIDQQLQRLEQSLQSLQRTISSAPKALAPAEPAPPPPPNAEIRTVVKTKPLPWTILLGFAGLLVMAVIGGFVFGRRGSLTRGLTETDVQLDRMLAKAANVMREMESTPEPAPTPRPVAITPSPKPPPPAPPRATPAPVKSRVKRPPAEEPRREPEPVRDNRATTDVDLELASGPSPQPQVGGLSNELLHEMDQALDNTRSMFTDVDRFIALGRTQNALSLLQFQVHKDPKDRDSWIKLMAIYRQEKMEVELARAAREFRNNFPNENLPPV